MLNARFGVGQKGVKVVLVEVKFDAFHLKQLIVQHAWQTVFTVGNRLGKKRNRKVPKVLNPQIRVRAAHR